MGIYSDQNIFTRTLKTQRWRNKYSFSFSFSFLPPPPIALPSSLHPSIPAFGKSRTSRSFFMNFIRSMSDDKMRRKLIYAVLCSLRWSLTGDALRQDERITNRRVSLSEDRLIQNYIPHKFLVSFRERERETERER